MIHTLYPASAGVALTAPLWFGPLGFLLWPIAALLAFAWIKAGMEARP